MTDARFPERWLTDRRVLRLPDGAFRTFITTLAYSVSNRTDGVIERDDLELINGADASHIPTLVGARLWSTDKRDVWQIVDFVSTQTSRDVLEVLENNRRRDRVKKARQRAEKKEFTPPVPGDVPGDGVLGDHAGEDRLGKDRTGRQVEGDWPPVARPGSCSRCGSALPSGLVQLGRTEHAGSCPSAAVAS